MYDALRRDLATIEAAVRKLNRGRVNVRREEHDQVLTALERLELHAHELDVQFKRMAQMQVELDRLKKLLVTT